MKVFLSWSGERSQFVAEAAKQWLLDTVHVTRPWISTHDIQRGALWMSTINEQLADTGIGIVFLTRENMNRPWILFEAGALAKGLPESRVCTFLIDVDTGDLTDPLAQFNATLPNEDSTLALLRTINMALGEHARDDSSLRRSHEKFWPDFASAIEEAKSQTIEPPRAPAATQADMMAQLLDMNKTVLSRIARLEKRVQDTQAFTDPEQRLSSNASALLREYAARTNAALAAKHGIAIGEAVKHSVGPGLLGGIYGDGGEHEDVKG